MVAVLVLLAAAPANAVDPSCDAGPEAVVMLTASEAVEGEPLVVTAAPADPGTKAYLYQSEVGAEVGYCQRTTCVDLDPPVTLASTATVDGIGIATFTVDLADDIGGTSLYLQAVVKSGGGKTVSEVAVVEVQEAPRNVLVVLFDDLGVDKVGLYGIGSEVPQTPTLDRLADEGVVFEHAYAQPFCTPTRAAIQTGRGSYRTGVGHAIGPPDDYDLPESEVTLPEMLNSGGTYATTYVGKWHLSTVAGGFYDHPNRQGYDWYSGPLMGVAQAAYTSDGLPQSFFDWERTENGTYARSTTYVETSVIDDAVLRVSEMSEPWFLMVGLVNPHEPYHRPPDDLYAGPAVGDTLREKRFHWMVEAADSELGRLLDSIDPDVLARTTVIVTADNGTHGEVVGPGFDPARDKGTMYEGGVHVPLLVSGPTVAEPGQRIEHLVHMTDLFPTIAEITGAEVDPLIPLDGVSFAGLLADPAAPPTRDHVYCELFEPLGFGPWDYRDQMVRDERWKPIRTDAGDELYDLLGLDVEGANLLDGELTAEQQAAYDRLAATMDEY